MRSECKVVALRISYEKHERNCTVTVARGASIDFGMITKFEDVADFLQDWEKCMAGYRYCLKNALLCKIDLSVGLYERQNGELVQCGYDRWWFDGIPEDAEGLHLIPDERYTDECHDIYITFAEPLLGELAEANI